MVFQYIEPSDIKPETSLFYINIFEAFKCCILLEVVCGTKESEEIILMDII